jgi:hypothetical protein
LYYHHANKHAILATLLDRSIRSVIVRCEQGLASRGSGQQIGDPIATGNRSGTCPGESRRPALKGELPLASLNVRHPERKIVRQAATEQPAVDLREPAGWRHKCGTCS